MYEYSPRLFVLQIKQTHAISWIYTYVGFHDRITEIIQSVTIALPAHSIFFLDARTYCTLAPPPLPA